MLDELLQQKEVINLAILKSLEERVLSIRTAAENMVECATNIKGQGYITFIQSRDDFLNRVEHLQEELTKSSDAMNINKHTYRK